VTRFSSAVQAVLDGTGLRPLGEERVASLVGSACAEVVRYELRLQKTSRGRVLRVPVDAGGAPCAVLVAVLPYGRSLHVDETLTALDAEVDRATPDELVRLPLAGCTTAYRSALELERGPVTTERAYVGDGTRVLALGTRTRGTEPGVDLTALLGTATDALWRRT